ncbi:MAG: SAM-dependent methyltransferase [Limisphaerales bacterium]
MAVLYKKRLFDVGSFCRRFGARELFLIPLRKLVSPLVLMLLGKRQFQLNQLVFQYYYSHRFTTWSNERCVEVPVGLDALGRYKSENILEIGNVLSQFIKVRHTVLDKYQESPVTKVVNEDICTVDLKRKYDLILSISTLEHVGYDEGDDDEITRKKTKMAFQNCLNHLSEGGCFLVTIPIGYNPVMTDMLEKRELCMETEFYMHRVRYSTWRECDRATALTCCYGKPYPCANALYIASNRRLGV